MPITQDQFITLRERYAHRSSWALWRVPENLDRLRSHEGIDDLSIFDDDNIPLNQLHPEYVFVGLNCANNVARRVPFSMFHSELPHAIDYKLRYVLHNTKFWGSYITDALHNMTGVSSRKIMRQFRDACRQGQGQDLLDSFLQELEDVEQILGRKPLLIAMGGRNNTLDVLKWAKDANLLNGYEIEHITHYSSKNLSYDQYRQEIEELERRVCHMRQDAVLDNTVPNGSDTIAARHISRCVTNAESQSSRRSGTETDSVLRNAVTAMASFLKTTPDYRNNQVCLLKSNNGRLMLRFTSRNPSIRFNYEVRNKHAFADRYGTVLSDWGKKHGFQVNLGKGEVPGNGVQFIPNNNMDVANLDCDILKKMGDSIVAKLSETIGK